MIYQFENDMKPEQAINIAKGCVMASFMDSGTKQAVIEVLSQVDISKTETTSGLCWYCIGIQDHKIVSVKTVVDEFGRELPAYDTPYNYCPNCGRPLPKPPEREINNERFLELCKQYGFAVQQDSQSPGIFLRQKDGTLREVTCFTPENEGSK